MSSLGVEKNTNKEAQLSAQKRKEFSFSSHGAYLHVFNANSHLCLVVLFSPDVFADCRIA
jgi:hypothetical protein